MLKRGFFSSSRAGMLDGGGMEDEEDEEGFYIIG